MVSYTASSWKLWRVFVVLLLLAESDGLVSSMIGIDDVIAAWSYSAFVLGLFAITMVRYLMFERQRQVAIFFYPLLVCVMITLVSAGSAIIFPKSLADWLPSLYVFAPLLLFYSFYLCRVTELDIAVALILLSAFVSALILFDSFSQLPFLDEYTRKSVFLEENRRVVLVKNEVIFGIIICLALVVGEKIKHGLRLTLSLLLAAMIFSQVTIMESRLAWLAMVIGFIVILQQYGFGKKRVFAYSFVTIVAVIIAGFNLFDRYIMRLLDMLGGGLDQGANISVRVVSVIYFWDVYLESHCWGIGMMSATGSSNNVLHSSSLNIADIGAWSSIFQFGILGLLTWAWLTYVCFKSFHEETRQRKLQNNRAMYMPIAANALLAGFTISVLPLSLFTQEWTISVGAVLLYLLWLYRCR